MGSPSPTQLSSAASTFQEPSALSSGASTLQNPSALSTGVSTFQNLFSSLSRALSANVVGLEVDESIIDENKSGILAPLGTPERVDHRAGCYEHQGKDEKYSDASSSSEPDLTDSSSED